MAVDNKPQKPLESHAHGATNAVKREAFQQQALNEITDFIRDPVLLEAIDKLTATVQTYSETSDIDSWI